MSFKKIQYIDPTTIGNPESNHIYFGRDENGLWEKYSNGNWIYITTGITTSGYDGTSGSSGKDGVDGTFFGSHGTSGSSGKTGTSGSSGKTGTSGTNGTTGTSGSSGIGTSGSSGSSGITGTSGSSGSSGETGTSGSSGVDGIFYGSSGISGGYGGSARKWIGTHSFPTNTEFRSYSTTYPGNYNFLYVNTLEINITDFDGVNLDYWLQYWNDGIIKIENWFDPSKFGIYRLNTAYTLMGNTYKFDNIIALAGNSSLISGTEYLISFAPSFSGVTSSGGTGSSGTSGVNGTFFGSSGTSGSGSSGTSGSGSSGTSGSGSSGTSGETGSSGTSGTSGTSGETGSSGTSGETGSSGTSGETGSSGTSGIGTSGSSGSSGSSGISGSSGSSGSSVSGNTYEDIYYDSISKTLFVPNITLTGSTVKITNIQTSIDNNTKLIISGDTLYQVTGTTNLPLLVISVKTSDYTLLETDDVILVSGSTLINITMPPISASNPNGYYIKNIGYGEINFNIYNNELIDGNSVVGILNHNTAVKLIPYIDNWYIF